VVAGTTVEGVVRAILPRALYRVEIDGGREVVAHAGADVKRNFIRLLVGDRVSVALMSRDTTRGRVVRKL
jgi:translation initiation factor IF-1